MPSKCQIISPSSSSLSPLPWFKLLFAWSAFEMEEEFLDDVLAESADIDQQDCMEDDVGPTKKRANC